MSAIAFDPLQKVPSLAVLHHNKHLFLGRQSDGVEDFHDVLIFQSSLDFYLQ